MIKRAFQNRSGVRIVEVDSVVADRTFVAESEFRSASKMLWLYTEAGTRTSNRIHRPYLIPGGLSGVERLLHILNAVDVCKRCPPTREAWRLYALGYIGISEAGCDELTKAGRETLQRWRKAQNARRVA